jgi:hypothetical protein
MFGSDPHNQIAIHPVNQSGASLNEVSDMDIFRNSKFLITNELKDKVFSVNDVRHATYKVKTCGLNTLFSIKSLSSKLTCELSEKELEAEQLKNNFVLCFMPITDCVKYIMNLSESVNLGKAVEFIYTKANQLKFKQKPKQH